MMRLLSSVEKVEDAEPVLRSFDDYDVTLGDVMRGERATLGKSLMDVQRELKIKAAYIAAVENADPTVFDTPGFIAGYVRSYAKYLELDPEWAFEKFCKESNFATSHGMSEKALPARTAGADRAAGLGSGKNPLESGVVAYSMAKEPFWAQIDGRALGSSLVLLTLVAGLGFGAYTVVQEIQQVDVAPFEQPPILAADLNPLAPRVSDEGQDIAALNLPTADALDRLYRPNALTTPSVTPRDGPIGQLGRNSEGAYVASAEAAPQIDVPSAMIESIIADVTQSAHEGGPQLRPTGLGQGPQEIAMFATQGVWVRVRAADNTVLYEKIMDAGEQFVFPATETPSIIERVGNSGALYFKVNGELFGPAGQPGQTVKDIVISEQRLTERYNTPTGDLPQDLKLVLLQLEGQ